MDRLAERLKRRRGWISSSTFAGSGAGRLQDHSRLGETLDGETRDAVAPCEARQLIIGGYEMRREIRSDAIYTLRLPYRGRTKVAAAIIPTPAPCHVAGW